MDTTNNRRLTIQPKKQPKLWIYGCSMSNKHDYDTHDDTWYTKLANKLDRQLELRSKEGFGLNAIERTIFADLTRIDRENDLVIFCPSFWHRVYMVEFKDNKRGFYPNTDNHGWYKDMRNMDEIIKMNYERWVTICEVFLKLEINFRTWLLDSPLSESYPFETAGRISNFDHNILKPNIYPQVLSWMALQKQQPNHWYDSNPKHEDFHYNILGHQYICDQFYSQIENIPKLI